MVPGDRSERVELTRTIPRATSSILSGNPALGRGDRADLPGRDLRTLPPSKLAAQVVKVEAASFAIEPVVRPEACAVIESVDVTERMLPLLPKAFEMLPTG